MVTAAMDANAPPAVDGEQHGASSAAPAGAQQPQPQQHSRTASSAAAAVAEAAGELVERELQRIHAADGRLDQRKRKTEVQVLLEEFDEAAYIMIVVIFLVVYHVTNTYFLSAVPSINSSSVRP